jgi:integrase
MPYHPIMLKRAGVEQRKFHSLRNTYATRLFEAGVPLKTVQKLLGHSSLTTTKKIYISVMPKEKYNVVDKLNAMFEGVV